MLSIKEKLSNLNNKKIAILGLGIENLVMLRFLLERKLNSEFIICDQRSKEQLGESYTEFRGLPNISWKLGSEFNRDLENFDIMYRSPGWPIAGPGLQSALSAGVKLESPMRLFFNLCPSKNIIGVTGTKGKGTTSSLIYEILKQVGRDVYIGGNIGEAPFVFFDKLSSDSWIVLELSSFQLEDMEASPKIAVFTNFYEDHLASADPNNRNYHSSMEEYWKAKINIFKWQKDNGKLVINKSLKKDLKKQKQLISIPVEIIYFTKLKWKSKLVGKHNQENVAAAVAVAEILDIPKESIKSVVAEFKGLPYRTEFIAKVADVKYFNDSFATNPDSTIIALASFEAPIVLLAGGADKGADFTALALEIKKRVKRVVLFVGAGSDKLRNALIKVKFDINSIEDAISMGEAFNKIQANIKPYDTVLMSTACASFGVFKNYKERGRLFNEEVAKLDHLK